MKKVKLKVDKTTCIQCGTCYSVLPEIYEALDDGTAQVRQEYDGIVVEDPDIIEKVLQVKDMCPSMSIIVEEVE